MASFDLFVDPAEVRSAGRKAVLIADDLAPSKLTSSGATTEATAAFEGWQVSRFDIVRHHKCGDRRIHT